MSSQTTSLRNSRSPSPTGYISSPAPANNGSPSVPRPSSSSASSAASSSSSSDGDSETTSAYYAREDQLQWDESVRQLKSIIHLCAIPFFGKWAGRKWGYYIYGRYIDVGLGRRFWLGDWGDHIVQTLLKR